MTNYQKKLAENLHQILVMWSRGTLPEMEMVSSICKLGAMPNAKHNPLCMKLVRAAITLSDADEFKAFALGCED